MASIHLSRHCHTNSCYQGQLTPPLRPCPCSIGNMFREAFKYYKRKQPPPDLSNVLRISDTCPDVEVIKPGKCKCLEDISNKQFGLIPTEEWNIFRINNKQGLIFIKNPFTALGQRYWIARCLKDFSRKPHKQNIDAHNFLNENENWWDICTTDSKRSATLSNKLRWATLGYHHNWDTKIYSELSKDVFPEDLAELCKIIAQIIGIHNFTAQAAIVNYYFMNSTLSGHTDHSEKNLDAPLFSFSYGQSAIFLIGGLTENDPALPILIDSGDILIMSQESRLCYHAIPKILPASKYPWNQCEKKTNFEDHDNDLYLKCKDDTYWKQFNDYIKTCRLNLNVRQVLKSGRNTLDDE